MSRNQNTDLYLETPYGLTKTLNSYTQQYYKRELLVTIDMIPKIKSSIFPYFMFQQSMNRYMLRDLSKLTKDQLIGIVENENKPTGVNGTIHLVANISLTIIEITTMIARALESISNVLENTRQLSMKKYFQYLTMIYPSLDTNLIELLSKIVLGKYLTCLMDDYTTVSKDVRDFYNNSQNQQPITYDLLTTTKQVLTHKVRQCVYTMSAISQVAAYVLSEGTDIEFVHINELKIWKTITVHKKIEKFEKLPTSIYTYVVIDLNGKIMNLSIRDHIDNGYDIAYNNRKDTLPIFVWDIEGVSRELKYIKFDDEYKLSMTEMTAIKCNDMSNTTTGYHARLLNRRARVSITKVLHDATAGEMTQSSNTNQINTTNTTILPTETSLDKDNDNDDNDNIDSALLIDSDYMYVERRDDDIDQYQNQTQHQNHQSAKPKSYYMYQEFDDDSFKKPIFTNNLRGIVEKWFGTESVILCDNPFSESRFLKLLDMDLKQRSYLLGDINILADLMNCRLYTKRKSIMDKLHSYRSSNRCIDHVTYMEDWDENHAKLVPNRGNAQLKVQGIVQSRCTKWITNQCKKVATGDFNHILDYGHCSYEDCLLIHDYVNRYYSDEEYNFLRALHSTCTRLGGRSIYRFGLQCCICRSFITSIPELETHLKKSHNIEINDYLH